MAPAQVPQQTAENEVAWKAIGDMLERQLTDIQKASSEKTVVELLTGRTVQLDALETLKNSCQQEGLFAIVDKVTEIFMAVDEAGKEAKQCLILSITESCVDIITSPAVILTHKIELLKSFNTLLENCAFSIKCEILGRNQFAEKLAVLYKSICQVGDYEVQVCTIEFIFRLVPKRMRTEYLKTALAGSEHCLEFLDINDRNFEVDCRHFLNKLNKQNTCSMARVYSYPAEVVSIDGVKLYKPNDSGYDDFWVDLNEGSKRIGIFCEPNFLSSQQSQNSEQLWETVSVWAQDVKRYTCSAQGMLWKAVIELKAGAEMISNKEPDNMSHVVTIVVAQGYNFKTTLEDILKIQHKASSVDTPVHIVQKCDLPVTSSTARSECVQPVVETLSQKKEERNGSSVTRSKISVPSEPMTTPASSVITSSSDHPTLWQEIHERQRLQKERLEKVFDRSDNAGRDNVSAVVELCDIGQENERHTLQVSNTSNVTCYANANKCLESEQDVNDRSFAQVEHTGSNKSINTTAGYENRGHSSNTVNEIQKGVCENSAERTSYRSRSQAKVKASEKCTDMTLHYMDARASDALVDVVNSQVTASGDNIFSQASPAKHSCATAPKNGSNEVDKRMQQECSEANAGEQRKCQLKGSCDLISSAASDSQFEKTPTRSLRSRKRTCAAVVSVPITKSDLGKTQSDSQLDIIPGTIPEMKRPDTRQFRRGNRKIQKNQKIIVVNTCEDEIVISPSASIPEGWYFSGCKLTTASDVNSCNKKRKTQQAGTERKSNSKNIHKAVATTSKVPVISPGNISLDDFKPSNRFRPLRNSGRKVTEKSNNTACKKLVDKVNTGAAKDQNKANKRMQAKEKCAIRSGKDNAEINSDFIALKDFLPVLQNSEETANEIPKKISPQDTGVTSDVDEGIREKTKQISIVYIEPDNKSVSTIRACETEKRQELESNDREHDIQSEVASVSSSGELFIEASKEADKECVVIKETQCEPSPPVMSEAEAADANKGAFVIPQQLSKTGRVNLNVPGSSGDCISPSVGTGASLNLENSYIFAKNTVMNAKYAKTSTFEGKQSKLGNSQRRLKSPVSKNKFVGAGETCKINVDNLVSNLNIAKPTSPSKDKINVEVCVEKTVKSTTKAKQLSQVNQCYEMHNRDYYTVSGKERAQTSNSFSLASPARLLRSRNKTVSYKEYDSDGSSSYAEDAKRPSKKSEKTVVQNDLFERPPSQLWNNVCEISPIGTLTKRQTDIYSINKLGLQAPKKAKKNVETKNIWTKHKMEKTVTTMSYSKSVFSLSSDPYDFEAESRKRYDDTLSVVPLRSHLFTKDNLYDKADSASDKVNYKKQDSRQFVLQSASSKKTIKNKSMNDVDIPNATDGVYGNRNFEPYAGKKRQYKPSCKKTPAADASIDKGTSHHQKNRHLSKGGGVTDINSGSDRGSSQFGLFASQIEYDTKLDTSDTGLVFPHLDDSIPCTPLHEENNNEDLDAADKKSVTSEMKCVVLNGLNLDPENRRSVFNILRDAREFPYGKSPCSLNGSVQRSDLSWLVQAKKALDKQEQKKGKTYTGHKSAEACHSTVYTDDLQPGPQYKQVSKTPDKLDQTSKLKTKGGTPGRHKFFSPLDFSTVSRKSQVSHPESKGSDADYKKSTVRKNQKDKPLASALKSTSLELTSLLEKKDKKNLSFRSPSIVESSSSELAASASEDTYSLSKDHNTKSGLTIATSGKSVQGPSNAKKQCNDESLSLSSADLNQQLQDVADSMSGSTERNLYTGTVSGPSSYKRPTRSQLKRKYPNMSTSTENSNQGSDKGNVSEQETRTHKHAFIPRKLFKSDATPCKPDRVATSLNKIGHAMKTAAEPQHCKQFSPAVEKHITKKKSGNWPPRRTVSDRERKFKHYSCCERFDEKLAAISKIGSKLTFDLCSPEKARSSAHSSGEDFLKTGLESSPLALLDLSSTHSPVVGFDERSSIELDVDGRRQLQRTSLLDSVRSELFKSRVSQLSDEPELSRMSQVSDEPELSRVSQLSDEPELSADAGALDFSEAASTDVYSLQEFLMTQNLKKIPLGSDDIDGAVKSAHQHITSLWETDQRKSMNAVKKYQSVAQKIFTSMNKDLKEMQENEIKVNLLWSQEMEKIRRHSMIQKKQLTRLKKAHEVLLCELEKVHADGETTQKSLKTVMKQDLQALQRKLVAKCNDHALDAMRKCLHMSLLL